MKLVSLNIWGSSSDRINTLEKSVLDFLVSHSESDFFCLQEIWNGEPKNPLESKIRDTPTNLWFSGYRDVQHALFGYKGLVDTSQSQHGGYTDLAIFAKQEISIRRSGDTLIYRAEDNAAAEDWGHRARGMQYVMFDTTRGTRALLNMKGLWRYKAGKVDMPVRLEQSRMIVEFVRTLGVPYIIAGDFNLSPGTESLRILEQAGMRNLIREYGITSTRTSYYKGEERCADYIFVSPEIEVREFKVLPDEVSDHSPLYLEFE